MFILGTPHRAVDEREDTIIEGTDDDGQAVRLRVHLVAHDQVGF